MITSRVPTCGWKMLDEAQDLYFPFFFQSAGLNYLSREPTRFNNHILQWREYSVL